MLVVIPEILDPDRLALCRERLAEADWQDGRITAGAQSARVKANQQLPDADPTSRALGDMVLRALEEPHHVRIMNRSFGSLFIVAGTLLATFRRSA